jgi:hypothetical protein
MIYISILSGAYSPHSDRNRQFRGIIIEILARNNLNLQNEQRKP